MPEYTWIIIVVAVIVLFALIGFLADRDKKKKTKETSQPAVEIPTQESTVVTSEGFISANSTSVENTNFTESTDASPFAFEEKTNPTDVTTSSEPLEDIPADIFGSLEQNTVQPMTDVTQQANPNIDPTLFQSINNGGYESGSSTGDNPTENK